jgi:uncharacterized protein YacL
MWLVLVRILVVVLLAHSGWVYAPFPERWIGGALGIFAALGLITLERKLRAVPGHHMVGALIGGVIGLFGARMVWGALDGLDIIGEHFVHALVVVFLGYMGIVIGGQKGEWFEPARIIAAFRDSSRLHQYKVLDTSVIIDGRILDIAKTGFVDMPLVILSSVLRELQMVADSADATRRRRGRRGLDVLTEMQKDASVNLQVEEDETAPGTEIDAHLVRTAKRKSWAIMTNDFNLNRIARLEGVAVLNLNELAQAMRPVAIPGEEIVVTVAREGKEAGQGVGSLDDGTMVVIQNGRRLLNQTITAVVTSVIQTSAGRMIFAEPAGTNGRRPNTRGKPEESS